MLCGSCKHNKAPQLSFPKRPYSKAVRAPVLHLAQLECKLISMGSGCCKLRSHAVTNSVLAASLEAQKRKAWLPTRPSRRVLDKLVSESETQIE
jgi:hypothetical protein